MLVSEQVMRIAWMGFILAAAPSYPTPEIVNWGLFVIFGKKKKIGEQLLSL